MIFSSTGALNQAAQASHAFWQAALVRAPLHSATLTNNCGSLLISAIQHTTILTYIFTHLLANNDSSNSYLPLHALILWQWWLLSHSGILFFNNGSDFLSLMLACLKQWLLHVAHWRSQWFHFTYIKPTLFFYDNTFLSKESAGMCCMCGKLGHHFYIICLLYTKSPPQFSSSGCLQRCLTTKQSHKSSSTHGIFSSL